MVRPNGITYLWLLTVLLCPLHPTDRVRQVGFFVRHLTDIVQETLAERIQVWAAKDNPNDQQAFAKRLRLAEAVSQVLLHWQTETGGWAYHPRPSKIGFVPSQGRMSIKLIDVAQARPEGSIYQSQTLLQTQDGSTLAYPRK